MKIRRTSYEDIPCVMNIFTAAKQTMRSSGNLHQWTGGYPSESILRNDIENHNSYVVEDAKNHIVATFACIVGEEPTYKMIYEGHWIDDSPYCTIHRIASIPEVHGVAELAFEYALGKVPSLRIDTHRDNIIMRYILQKSGFKYCGIIYLLNGDERLAYQKTAVKNK